MKLARLLRLAGLACLGLAALAAPAGSSLLSVDASPAAVRTTLAQPEMQAVNAPARVARVAEVPGTGGAHAWAFGYTGAVGSGPSAGTALGQLVFLEYTSARGWQITGAPLGADGHPFSPRLSALAVTGSGEGWAVGEAGVVLHHRPGDAWRFDPAASVLTSANLESISLAGGGGYAVGQPSGGTAGTMTALRLSGGTWSRDTVAATCTGGNTAPDLVSVSTVSADEAWAVSGSSSQALCTIHRKNGAWAFQATEQQFDTQASATSSAQGGNQLTNGGAIYADQDGVWIVGKMEPFDTQHPLGDNLTGDLSRPFVVHLDASGGNEVSYCPASYTVSAQGTAQPVNLCKRAFPLAAFGLTGVVAFGKQVYAGGMGLFHLADSADPNGSWEREPDAVGYLESLSMASAGEGWMVSSGSNAISGAPLSETLALGHWTTHPASPAMALWPDPVTAPLESVALAPDGSGRAIGVGGNGSHVIYLPGLGWNAQQPDGTPLHSVAWPASKSAWAVGNADLFEHYDGQVWHATTLPPQRRDAARDNLYGVAFAGENRGWAVGDYGALFDYSGGTWKRNAKTNSLTGANLYGVATVPGGALAVGELGTVILNQGGVWKNDPAAHNLVIGSDGTPQPLYAIAGLPDGTVAFGGGSGIIVVRSPQGAYSRLEPGIDGTVMALGLSRDASGALQVLASINPRSRVKFVGGLPATTGGWLFRHDASGWHDIELSHDLTMWVSTDSAGQHDPVLAIALEPRGGRGWAVGGFPALTLDSDNLAYERSVTRSSIYRVDPTSDPSPPSTLLQMPPLAPGTLAFAFLGDSACSDGVCGAGYGSGTRSDVVLQKAQQDINWVAQDPNGPKLVAFGGNMGRIGLPEELNVFKRSMQGWSVPFFAALGDKDLVAGTDVASQVPTVPNPPSPAPPAPDAQSQVPTPRSNTLYLDTFADAPGPWGSGAFPRGVSEYSDPTMPAPSDGEARSFYAFDFAPPGKGPQARFIFLNDSEGTTAGTHDNPAASPQTETQVAWLQKALGGSLPTFVIMNIPTQDPRAAATDTADSLQGADQQSVEVALEGGGTSAAASAVFASHVTGNIAYSLAQPAGAVVPVYISGGAGSPLGIGAPSRGSHLPSHGWYHGWLLVTADTQHKNSAGQAHTNVLSMPVLDSVAMSLATPPGGWDGGVAIRAGNPTYATALGRLPDAGIGNTSGLHPDPAQSKADYIQIPEPPDNLTPVSATTCAGTEVDREECPAPADSVAPYHRFWVENPKGQAPVAEFVQPQGGPGNLGAIIPALDEKGNLIPDDQTGFLCALNPGTAWINVVIGLHRARQQLTVTSGSGVCNPHPHPVPPVVVKPVPVVAPQPPAPAPQFIPVPHPHHLPQYENPLVAAVLPPPVPVLAAAPPLPAAGTAAKKEEQREHAFEHSSEKGDGHQAHHAVAYAGPQNTWDARPAAVGGTSALLFFIAMAVWTTYRRKPQAAFDWRRWE